MTMRKFLAAAVLLLTVTALSVARSSTQYFYYGYVAGTAVSPSSNAGYFLMDVQNGSERQIYFDMKDYNTGQYFRTNNPAGNQIRAVQLSEGHLYYAGDMYSGRKLVNFELTVCSDAAAGCGFAARFIVKDKKTGKVLVNRYDLLDSTATVYVRA